VITDSQLQLFVRALTSHKHVKRGAITRADVALDIPEDVRRVLDQVGGWRYGDLRFTETLELLTQRDQWNGLVDAFEAGRSDTWSHAFWHRTWFPLATSSHEVYAYDPTGCFGGTPQQVVSFDFKGGETWLVFPTIGAFLAAFADGFEADPKVDAIHAAKEAARTRHAAVVIPLPGSIEDRRSPQRFEAGVGAWLVLRHPDGRVWAIRERRDGYEVRIGEGEDAIIRKRKAVKPSADVRKLVREQKAEGFLEA
jgi:cell wall assembly regulator SMI1